MNVNEMRRKAERIRQECARSHPALDFDFADDADDVARAFLEQHPEDGEERTEEVWLATLGGKRRGDWDFYFQLPDDDNARLRIYMCPGSGVWSAYAERTDRPVGVLVFGSVKTRQQVRDLCRSLGIPLNERNEK